MSREAKAKLQEWTSKHPESVLYDEAQSTLLDVYSGRLMRFPWSEVAAFEEKRHPETGDSYLVFLLNSGVQVVLVDPGGVAFAPSFSNTGPLPRAPQVTCLRDFDTIKGQIEHAVYDHPDQEVPRECLDALMLCIAILDGARVAGFGVGDLEEGLEALLREVESRRS